MAMNNSEQVIRHDLETTTDATAFWTEERLRQAQPVCPRRRSQTNPSRGNEERTMGMQVTRSRVHNETIYPYSAVGKLYFTVNGTPDWGTAWIVAESIIVTAGHCVFAVVDDDTWEVVWCENMVFYPQYANGASELGGYPIKTSFTLQGWYDEDDLRYDLAMCRTAQPMNISRTGVLGFRVPGNVAAGASVLSIGYQGGDGTDQDMWESSGEFVRKTDPSNQSCATNALKPGASGGPWLLGNASVAYGINSHKDESWDDWFSPYFGQGMVNLRNAADQG